MTSHNDRVGISVILGPAPIQSAVFTTALLLSSTSSLGADTVRTYASTSELDTDVDAGELSAAAAAACTAALSDNNVELVKVGAVTSYDSTDLNTVIAADPLFYGLSIESRADADIDAIATAVEALDRKLFVAQSDDAGLKTAGLPLALAGLDGLEQSALVYHDDDAVFADFAWLAGALAFDPANTSAPWNRNVAGIDAAASVTEGEKALVRANNVNVPLAFFNQTAWMDPGVNLAGRPLHELVTRDFLIDRLQTRVASAAAQFAALGQKWPLNRQGQGVLSGIVSTVLQELVATGHIDPGQFQVTRPTITDSDRSNRILRVQFVATILGHTLTFDVVGGLVRDPIFPEA